MRKIIFSALLMAAVIVADNALAGVDAAGGADNIGINDNDSGISSSNIDIGPIPVHINRKGRAVQVDGFLLEWNVADARPWVGSSWTWDAVITAHGVAGYFSHPGSVGVESSNSGVDSSGTVVINPPAPECPSWMFTITAPSTKKSFTMAIPENPSSEFFAYDKGTFESGGALTVEWLVPWSFFEDEDGEDGDADAYVLALAAACGSAALPPMSLSVVSPKAPKAPIGLPSQIAMIALTAALTVALALHRRRKIREIGRK